MYKNNTTSAFHLSTRSKSINILYCQLSVDVQVPLCESVLGWLCELDLSLATLANREIAAYVHDQIAPLNLTRLRAAKLVRKGIFQICYLCFN